MITKILDYSKHLLILFTITIWFGLFIIPHAFAADSVRMGFVDLQRAVSATKEWKRQLSSLKTEANKEKLIIQRREKRIKKMFDDIKKREFVMDQTLKEEKQKKFRNERKKLDRYVKDLNEEFTIKEREASQKIFKKMILTIQKIGKEKKLSMIADRSTFIYFSKEQDLTDLAIKIYNKTHK